MELRSYNVESIWKDSVKCVLGEEIGIDTKTFENNIPMIKDMLSQIETTNGITQFFCCNKRKDGEIWTPYLQIVEMLIRMGKRIGCVEYSGKLTYETILKITV